MQKALFSNIVFTAILLGNLSYTTLYAQSNRTFLTSPKIIKNPESDNRYAVQTRKFTGIPSMAITAQGRMWATWYSGSTGGEDANNYVVVSTSIDNGNTWKEVFVIDPDGPGPVRAYDPEIWVAPDGVLYFFWTQTIGHEGQEAGVWIMTTNAPDLDNPNLSPPKRISDGDMMCKPTVLSNGDWLLPVSTWLTDNSAKVIVSVDQGKSWKLRGACNVPDTDRTFDENMIYQKNDGSLVMLVRTKYGIGKSVSKDGGRTWTPLERSSILHPSARFFIRKLNSGNLLLVKHGPIQEKTGRSRLMAFLSTDDGDSWLHGLLLDARSGVSYPDGQQTSDGKIYIVYDYSRTKEQHILLTSFSENDIVNPDYDSQMIQVFRNRKIVSDGGSQ
jgi:predicted neuraminidase